MYYAERALLLCQYYSQDQTLEQKLYDANPYESLSET